MTSYMHWSTVIPLLATNKGSIPNVPGVYRIYIVDAKMNPLPIMRRNDKWDNDAIMYIGGTTRSGTLNGRFNMHLRAHDAGMMVKIEKDGREHDLAELWRCIYAVYPNAGLAFQYCELPTHEDAKSIEKQLHQKYKDKYGEYPESGMVSLLHNTEHPWRKYLYGRK